MEIDENIESCSNKKLKKDYSLSLHPDRLNSTNMIVNEISIYWTLDLSFINPFFIIPLIKKWMVHESVTHLSKYIKFSTTERKFCHAVGK